MYLIGVRGYRRSGKDTFAKLAIDFMEGGPVKVGRRAFGDALKEELAAWLAVMCPDKSYAEHLRIMYSNGPEKEKYRKLMEFWGTEFRRAFYGQNYWVERLDIWAKENKDIGILFIPDVRFIPEVEYIKKNNGILVNIVNPRIKAEDIGTHSAEHELDNYTDWDYTINNDGTLRDLQIKAEDFMFNRDH